MTTAILLATYQGAAYLDAFLASLAAQTDQDFTCYIHDDGSSDETPAIIRGWCEKDPAHFIQLEGPTQGSAKANFLWMLSQVEADVYLFADQDDVWLPEKAEIEVARVRERLASIDNDVYTVEGVNSKEAEEGEGAEERKGSKEDQSPGEGIEGQSPCGRIEDQTSNAQGIEASEDDGMSAVCAKYPVCIFCNMYVTDQDLHVMDDSFIRYIGRDPYELHLGRLLVDNPAAGCTMAFTRRVRDLALRYTDIEKLEMHDAWVMAVAAAADAEASMETEPDATVNVDAEQSTGDATVCLMKQRPSEDEKCDVQAGLCSNREGKSNTIIYVDTPLVYYRQHDDNVMGAVAESRMQKILRNLREICDGTAYRKKKAFVQQARDLAGQLVLVDGIDEEKRQWLGELAEMGRGKPSKFERVRFYRKHHIDRSHGTAWMMWWV